MFLEIVIDTYNKSGVADPNPGSGVSLTQGAGSVMAKKYESGMNIQDNFYESL
jgi:hypothetical protein